MPRGGFLIQCGHFGLEDQAAALARRSLSALGCDRLQRDRTPQKGIALLVLEDNSSTDPAAIYGKLVASHTDPAAVRVGGNTRKCSLPQSCIVLTTAVCP